MINLVIERLKEREKELNCLYEVEKLLKKESASIEDILQGLTEILPPGWQYPTICEVRITYEDKIYKTEDFKQTEWMQYEEIIVDNNIVGRIEVVYIQFIKLINDSQFLPEEQKLLHTIAGMLSNYIFFKKLKHTLSFIKSENKKIDDKSNVLLSSTSDEHWKWRLKMSKLIASHLTKEEFGVEALYVIGSTNEAIAGPASDIDLLVHFTGNDNQKQKLLSWMEGWSLCLTEMNYDKTGYRIKEGLIDLHIVTNEDINMKSSYAVMINSVHNPAKRLRLANEKNR